MNRKAKTAAAVALSAVLACGMLAGCDLVTTDSLKDYKQVIATVDITKSEQFASGGIYESYADTIEETEILKRDMVASFISSGYSAMQTYGWTYYDTFSTISDSLVNRQIYIQYAKVYLMENGDAEGNSYSAEGYRSAVSDGDDTLADLRYFLTDEEQAQALYATYVLFNNTIDSQEESYIDSDDDSSSSVTVRTTPTGVDTENDDYYDSAYRVYIGSNSAANCGSYETIEGSTPATRRKAYNAFLANLRTNDLLENGENTSEIESLAYFKSELRTQYESVIITKLTDLFEKEAEEILTENWIKAQYDKTYADQKEAFASDKDTFESALDELSDSSFLLTAPEEYYGYVVNILLPFSTTESAALSSFAQDYGDTNGNYYVQRAALLKNLKATDQRATWFTGTTDYSFNASESTSSISEYYTGNDSSRSYLFFEDQLYTDYSAGTLAVYNDATQKNYTDQYEKLANYYGRYTYNGSVYYDSADDQYILTPNRISVDEFITEMESYLEYAGLSASGSYVASIDNGSVSAAEDNTVYYGRGVSDYYQNQNNADYSSFVYYAGSVAFDSFDANNLFLTGSQINTAYSVINELSFAYNTDTSGLNTYLGYSVVTGATSYVSEFEYAAQWACKQGAGTYVVVPSDYGWHIIYCTFSFVADGDGEIEPFSFDYSQITTKGTFSYLYYETLKATVVSEYSTNMQNAAINAYLNDDCVTVYESRYADLSGLDS